MRLFFLVRTLLDFLKQPYEPESTFAGKEKVKLFFQLLLLDVIIALLLGVFISYLEDSFGIEADNYLYKLQDYLTPGIFLFLTVPLLPFIEEVIFRLPLRYRANPLFWLVYGLTSLNKGSESAKAKTLAIWHKSYPIIFYLLLIVFVLLHLSNFDLSTIELYEFPIFLFGFMPLFITGFFISFIRLTSGFFSGFFFHASHNLIVFLVFLLALGSPEKQYHEENNAYSIRVEKSGSLFYDKRASYLSRDSISITRHDLEAIINEVDNQTAYIANKANGFNPKVNVFFHSKALKHDLDKQEIVLKGLEKAFELDINTYKRKRQVLHLKIMDSARFQSLLTDTSSWSVYESMVEVEMENAPISRIVEELKKQTEKPVITRIPDTLRLKKFQIRKGQDIAKLRKALPKQYGLSLSESEKTLPLYEIRKKNSQ